MHAWTHVACAGHPAAVPVQQLSSQVGMQCRIFWPVVPNASSNCPHALCYRVSPNLSLFVASTLLVCRALNMRVCVLSSHLSCLCRLAGPLHWWCHGSAADADVCATGCAEATAGGTRGHLWQPRHLLRWCPRCMQRLHCGPLNWS